MNVITYVVKNKFHLSLVVFTKSEANIGKSIFINPSSAPLIAAITVNVITPIKMVSRNIIVATPFSGVAFVIR